MLSVRKEILPCDMETIWAVITRRRDTGWRSDLDRVEWEDDTHFVEYTKGGTATRFTVTASHPPRHWALALENPHLTGRWTGMLEPVPEGTRVIFAESVFPRRCWLRPLVGLYLKRQQKQYFADLRRCLAEQ